MRLLPLCALLTTFACIDVATAPSGLTPERNQESEVNVAEESSADDPQAAIPEPTSSFLQPDVTLPSSVNGDVTSSASTASVTTWVVPVTTLSDQGHCRVWLDEAESPLEGADVTVQYSADPTAANPEATSPLEFKAEPMCSAPLLSDATATSSDTPPSAVTASTPGVTSAALPSSAAAPSTTATLFGAPDASSSTVDASDSAVDTSGGVAIDAGRSLTNLADAGAPSPSDAGSDAMSSVPLDLDAALAAPLPSLEELLGEGWYFVEDERGLFLELCPNLCASLRAAPGALLLSVQWGTRMPAAR